jgi:S1-C subfamily serine protease
MDLLDVIIILVTAASALHGLRLGAAVQILSYGGAIVGLVAGVALVSSVAPHLHAGSPRTFVALLLLLAPCGLAWGIGRQLGAHLWGRIQGHSVARLDAAAGGAIAMAGTLVFVWVVGSVLVSSPVPSISGQIQRSAILRGVNEVMPPIPTELASLEHVLNQDGFPLPVINFSGPLAPVKVAGSQAVRAAVEHAGRSTVRVVAYGCDRGAVVEKGSGFVTDGNLVVTNAHVIAGSTRVVVTDEAGDHTATPILFDPRFDLAVLAVPGLRDPSLPIDPQVVGRGTTAAVLGFPLGGPFDAQPAGVLAPLDATGFDIYNRTETTRYVYELQSLVRPGNSGGPLVEPDGRVIGVVFSRSATNDSIGFALSSPGVLQRVRAAARSRAGAVPTGACVNG